MDKASARLRRKEGESNQVKRLHRNSHEKFHSNIFDNQGKIRKSKKKKTWKHMHYYIKSPRNTISKAVNNKRRLDESATKNPIKIKPKAREYHC